MHPHRPLQLLAYMCGRAFCNGTRLTESGNYPFKMKKIILTACYMKAHECLHVGTGVSDIKNTNFVQAGFFFGKLYTSWEATIFLQEI
jgi:hypothetical protein